MKKLILVLFLLPMLSFAQNQVDALVGYKAVEVNFSVRTETLNYGIGVSAVDAQLAEKRANDNDMFYNHRFTQSYVPAVFGLLGGQFDEFQMVGKIGTAYVKQNINDKKDDKHFFFAVGVEFGYDINDTIGIKASFDNVNSFMGGLIVKI